MDELQYDRLKKVARIGIILFIFISILLLGVLLTRTIIVSSYKTEEILAKEIETVTAPSIVISDDLIGGYTAEEFEQLSDIDKTLALMYDVPYDDMVEASVQKSLIILSCEDSPWSEDISTAEYTVGKVSNGYKVDYNIGGEVLSVICSYYDATPVVYIKGTEFSEEEKIFFKKMGRSWEVQLDDGTHSIQYR